MKKNTALITALLGIVLGIMLAVTVNAIQGRDKKLRVSRDDWQKLELILQQISENYVEDVDYDAVTEAAASAALSALDPHSMYLPPVTLKESERIHLCPEDGAYGCQVPKGVWHTVEVLEPSVIYEGKDKKYGEDGSETYASM